MRTKAQIARAKYSCSLSDLTGGEKAAVTRAYNAQTGAATSAPKSTSSAGTLSVKFGRPNVNGVKECLVKKGTSVGDALKQSGMKVNTTKEGVLDKDTGAVVLFNHPAEDGKIYAIVPGVDSN